MTSQKENAQRQRELEEAQRQLDQSIERAREEERAKAKLEVERVESSLMAKYSKIEQDYNELYNRMEGSDIHWTEAGKAIMDKINMPSPDCRKCDHFKTCFIWRDIGGSMQGKFQSEEDLPFQLHETAKYCKYYKIVNEAKPEANLVQEIGR